MHVIYHYLNFLVLSISYINFIQAQPCIRNSTTYRKDILKLSAQEWNAATNAIWNMKNKPCSKTSKCYDYFISKHLVASFDSRTKDVHLNQGHGGPWFALFHSLLIREFEIEFLKNEPTCTLFGLPYWGWATSDRPIANLFTDKYFGVKSCDGDVSTGPFANWPISEAKVFDLVKPSTVTPSTCFYDSNAMTLLRSPGNNEMKPFLKRYFRWGNYEYNTKGDLSKSIQCNPNNYYTSVTKIQDCSIVGGTLATFHDCFNCGIGNLPGCSDSLYPLGLHNNIHDDIGGCGIIDEQTLQCVDKVGDFTTEGSTNDPLFWFVHANIDRQKFQWMRNNHNLVSMHYGYDTSKYNPDPNTIDAQLSPGLSLTDVVNSLWGFTDSDLNTPSVHINPTIPWTYSDAIVTLGYPNTYVKYV